MISKKKFKTESKQLLELMIHSIYSNKDVFLRELISNASDANDKRHFAALTDGSNSYDELKIEIAVDKENRKIIISDNGIGMSQEDLDKNLSTIAKSGTKEFFESLEEKDKNDVQTIGQFGVGFYASFIVADKVELLTKKADEKAYLWISDGIETYSVEESEKTEIGTQITLHLRDGEQYDNFLEKEYIKDLVKKHSDYIRYPIYMDMEKEIAKKDMSGNPIDGEFETVIETEKLNSQIALWKREKSKIKAEEYSDFYKAKYLDFNDPQFVIHSKVEGSQTFDLLVFIAKTNKNPFGMIEEKKGLDLYSKGVLIEENVNYLLDESLSFVKGLVDSSDLNLNISREMLQKDEAVLKIAKAVEKKIQKELEKKIKTDREKYNEFYEEYKLQLKFGIYNNYGMKKEVFKDLIQFKSSKTNEYTTFKEYLQNNEGCTQIYYAKGTSIEQINTNPVMKKALELEKEVLYFVDDIDEFAIQTLGEYKQVGFKSIYEEDFSSEEEKEKIDKAQKENKEILESLAKEINGVKEVKLTSNLGDEFVAIANDGALSLEMEKVLAKNPDNEYTRVDKVLELNPNHKLFNKLMSLSKDKQKEYGQLLFDQALLVEGFEIDNPKDFSENLIKILFK